MKLVNRIIIFLIMAMVGIEMVSAADIKFECGYGVDYVLEFYDNNTVGFYTMMGTYPDYTLVDFNTNRSSCPSTIFVNCELDRCYISETKKDGYDEFKLITPVDPDTNEDLGETTDTTMLFSCSIGHYIVSYWSDKTVKATNPKYQRVDITSSFNSNVSSCPTDLYEKIIGESATISDTPLDGFTKVDKTTDANAGSNTGGGYNPNTGLVGTDNNTGYTDMDCYGLLGSTSDPNDPAYWLQKALQVIRYAGIAALFIFSTVDFVKAIVNQDNDALRKAISTTAKRFIFAILIFFVPILTENILQFFGVYGTCAL